MMSSYYCANKMESAYQIKEFKFRERLSTIRYKSLGKISRYTIFQNLFGEKVFTYDFAFLCEVIQKFNRIFKNKVQKFLCADASF